jgi:hypothetical protein
MAQPGQAVHVSMIEPTVLSPLMFPVNSENFSKIKDEVAKDMTKYEQPLP